MSAGMSPQQFSFPNSYYNEDGKQDLEHTLSHPQMNIYYTSKEESSYFMSTSEKQKKRNLVVITVLDVDVTRLTKAL